MNGRARHWGSKRRQKDLKPVLRRPVEVTPRNRKFDQCRFRGAPNTVLAVLGQLPESYAPGALDTLVLDWAA